MTVLAATDGEHVPSRVVAVGDELATAFGEEFVVTHVLAREIFERRQAAAGGTDVRPAPHLASEIDRERLTGQPAADAPGGGNRYTLDRDGVADAANVARAVAEGTLDDPSAVTFDGHVGDPAAKILAAADRRDARYLVIGGRKRTSVGKAIFGSVTQSVILDADRPVVAVPEEGEDVAASGPVVAAVDRSERAERVVQEAAAIAEAAGRELHVVHCLSEDEHGQLAGTTGGGEGSTEDIRSRAASIAAGAADPVTDEYVAVGRVGEPAEQVLAYAGEREAGYLVAAGRKRTPVGKALFGSVTQSLVLNAAAPVVVTGSA